MRKKKNIVARLYVILRESGEHKSEALLHEPSQGSLAHPTRFQFHTNFCFLGRIAEEGASWNGEDTRMGLPSGTEAISHPRGLHLEPLQLGTWSWNRSYVCPNCSDSLDFGAGDNFVICRVQFQEVGEVMPRAHCQSQWVEPWYFSSL
jgi:hypothetical protein